MITYGVTFGGMVDHTLLEEQINADPGITVACRSSSFSEELVTLYFDDQLTQAEQDQLAVVVTAHNGALSIARARKIESLSEQCAASIVGGFASDALGTTHYYDSLELDQLNLIGAVAAGDSMQYGCRETEGGVKVYKMHTHLQLLTVIQDGRDIKLGHLQTFNTKKAAVMAAQNVAAVEDINW